MKNVFGLYRNTGPGVMFSSRTQGIFLKQTIVLFLIFMVNTAFGQNADFKWPGNARAAVCMTYDDGMNTHLEIKGDEKKFKYIVEKFFHLQLIEVNEKCFV